VNLRSARFATIGLGAAMLATAFAGCGGGDSDGLAKDDYIAQANQICADFKNGSAENEAAFTEAIQSNDLDAAASAFEKNGEEIGAAVEEFSQIDPPSEDQATIDEFVALSRKQVDLAGETADAIRNNDEQAFKELADESSQADEEADAIADEYGLLGCGSADG
jgi:hypothetical protein